MTTHDVVTIEAMISYGGSFVRALGEAARRADDDNLLKIKTAFPEYWEKYSKMSSPEED